MMMRSCLANGVQRGIVATLGTARNRDLLPPEKFI